MTTCDRSRGFTLLELIVVLAVLALIAGTAVPLAGAVVVAEKRDKATQTSSSSPPRSTPTTSTTRRSRPR